MWVGGGQESLLASGIGKIDFDLWLGRAFVLPVQSSWNSTPAACCYCYCCGCLVAFPWMQSWSTTHSAPACLGCETGPFSPGQVHKWSGKMVQRKDRNRTGILSIHLAGISAMQRSACLCTKKPHWGRAMRWPLECAQSHVPNGYWEQGKTKVLAVETHLNVWNW